MSFVTMTQRTMPIKKKGPLLDMKESAFFNALVSAVRDHGVVLAKVNMTNVITPSKDANKSIGLLLTTRSQKLL